MLNPVRLQSKGFRVGSLFFPALEVRAGEVICLHVPPACDEERTMLLDLFTSGSDTPQLSFHGSVAQVIRPMPPRGWFGRWRDNRIESWLIRSAGVEPEKAADLLRRWKIPEGERIGRIQWNPRTWIAFDAALARGAQIIVFDSAGNDPMGIRVIHDLLATCAHRPTVVEISCREDQYRICLPGAHCVSLRTEEDKGCTVTVTATTPRT